MHSQIALPRVCDHSFCEENRRIGLCVNPNCIDGRQRKRHDASSLDDQGRSTRTGTKIAHTKQQTIIVCVSYLLLEHSTCVCIYEYICVVILFVICGTVCKKNWLTCLVASGSFHSRSGETCGSRCRSTILFRWSDDRCCCYCCHYRC